ncbi:MAG: formylglycine-generating enzyme family protein, partial [Myxococcales bacterium]
MKRALIPLAVLLLAASARADAPRPSKRPVAPPLELSTMAAYPASRFAMGTVLEKPSPYGDGWFVDETPAHEVTLPAFYLDRHEVTVEAFARFLTHAGGALHHHPDQPIEQVRGGYLPRAGSGLQPMRQVTWTAAAHYCAWAGKRLPTEAEWERAASGASGRPYPWGDDGPS